MTDDYQVKEVADKESTKPAAMKKAFVTKLSKMDRQVKTEEQTIEEKLALLASLKLQCKIAEEELEKEKIHQQRLNQPLRDKEEKLLKKLDNTVKGVHSWKKVKKEVIAKSTKVNKVAENSRKVLQNLGLSFINEIGKTDDASSSQVTGLQLTKVNPDDPEAAYVLILSAFDSTDWSFQVTEAVPTFSTFKAVAEKANKTGDLLDLIVNCKKGWLADIANRRNSSFKKKSVDLFDNDA